MVRKIALALHPLNRKTGEQLVRLAQNPFYLQVYEFFLKESSCFSEILEEIGCNPVAPEQRERVRLQFQRMREDRLVLQQIRELVLSTPGPSPSMPHHVEV
jgi:hypothetical protein